MPELVEQARWVFERYGIDAASYCFEVSDAYDFLVHTERKFDVILCLGFFTTSMIQFDCYSSWQTPAPTS